MKSYVTKWIDAISEDFDIWDIEIETTEVFSF